MAGLVRAAISASALVAALLTSPATAAVTSVELSLSSVRAIVGTQATLLRFEGGILGDALVQLRYPLQLLVWERDSGRYVRFEVALDAFYGNAPQLSDGMTSSEAALLLWEGLPLRGTRVVHVGPERVDVLLPHGVLSGPVDAAAIAPYAGDVLVSNSVAVEGDLP